MPVVGAYFASISFARFSFFNERRVCGAGGAIQERGRFIPRGGGGKCGDRRIGRLGYCGAGGAANALYGLRLRFSFVWELTRCR